MDFIQKKTADPAVEHFIQKAADQEISLSWDRFEGQLPECGFCESGLSCRDCLQGPCISHPFRDHSKLGVCGKDKDILAAQSLLRLTVKGTMSYLDQLSEFEQGVVHKEIEAKDKDQTEYIIKEIQDLYEDGGSQVIDEFPKGLVATWDEAGIRPEGIARDLFKASQKLEGGICGIEETLLWSFKVALLGCLAQRLQEKLGTSVFGDSVPTKLEVNLGVLRTETPNILLYGHFSPLLKQKIAIAAQKKKASVMGVCTNPLLPPFSFSPVTSYGSQEIPMMTGAVDLVVAGDQWVNPSLLEIAKGWRVAVVSANALKAERDLDTFATKIVEQAIKAFDNRRDIQRDIPDVKESAVVGFSFKDVNTKRIVEGINGGKIKGVAIFSGSNNIKYTQDNTLLTMAQEFLMNDILCISEGEASVCLAKYGLLNPEQKQNSCGKGLNDLLPTLGDNIPAIIDWRMTDFLLALSNIEKKALKDYPIIACFAEANRSMEVVKALWTVATGVSTYFWPCLPVTGSPKTMNTMAELSNERFGSRLHVITEKIDARAKADLFIQSLKTPVAMSGKSWE